MWVASWFVWSLLIAVPLLIMRFIYRDPTYECVTQTPVSVPASAVSEGIRGYINTIPLGLRCEYLDAAGASIIVLPGWGLTTWTSIAVCVGIAMFALNRRDLRPRTIAVL